MILRNYSCGTLLARTELLVLANEEYTVLSMTKKHKGGHKAPGQAGHQAAIP